MGCHRGNLRVVRGDNYSLKQLRAPRRLDRPSNHGFAAKVTDVLARNALATTPGRYHGDGTGDDSQLLCIKELIGMAGSS
jgi:hypothetical protein